ncbi:hypothetical protein OAH46_01160 [Verrucomicrobia bacterium]|nr:hypothetical protein [Verrucomicrobiota bacterium]
MKIQNEQYTAATMLISLAILMVKYEIISFGSASLSAAWFTIENIQINKPNVLIVIVIILLLLSLFMHTRSMIPLLAEAYRKGYKFSKPLLAYVADCVMGFTGTNAHGSPYGDFKPSIKNKNINCGRFTTQAGLSSPLTIEVPSGLHLICIITGVREIVRIKIIAFQYSPIIIGTWALMKIFN